MPDKKPCPRCGKPMMLSESESTLFQNVYRCFDCSIYSPSPTPLATGVKVAKFGLFLLTLTVGCPIDFHHHGEI